MANANKIVRRMSYTVLAGALALGTFVGGSVFQSRKYASLDKKYGAALEALTASNKALTQRVGDYELINANLERQLCTYKADFSSLSNELAQANQKLVSQTYKQAPTLVTAKTEKPKPKHIKKQAHPSIAPVPIPAVPLPQSAPVYVPQVAAVTTEAAPLVTQVVEAPVRAPETRVNYTSSSRTELVDDHGILRTKDYMERRQAKIDKKSYQPSVTMVQQPAAPTKGPEVKGSLVNIQKLALDDEFRDEKRDGTYDSITSRIRKRASTENLEQREQRQADARLVQAKNNWSNPMTPIINYVDYANADSGTTHEERMFKTKESLKDLGDHLTSTLTFSYYSWDKHCCSDAAIADNLRTTNDFRYGLITKDFKLNLEKRLERLQGKNLSGEPFSDCLDYIIGNGINQTVQDGLSLGDLGTAALLRNVADPALEIPGDAADIVLSRVPKLVLFGPAMDVNEKCAPNGIKQFNNGFFRFLYSIFHYTAKVVGGKNGGLGNSDNPMQAAIVRGVPGASNHAGSNAEKLGAGALIGWGIHEATENPPQNKVTGGETGGPVIGNPGSEIGGSLIH